jgi:hypothetical protein
MAGGGTMNSRGSCAAFAGCVLVVALLACKRGASDCPQSYKELPEGGEGEHTCSCPAESDKLGGMVWGDSIYTTDSNPCKAAVHAGVIEPKGGKITLQSAPGCKNYVGSEKNGVTSQEWGSWKTSFYFPEKGKAECPSEKKAKKAKKAKKKDRKGGTKKGCVAKFNEVPDVDDETLYKCKCTADDMKGTVWGSHPYTADSNVCNAALHAGVVDKEGGKVKAKAFKGCSKYKGSKQNGVTSQDWGSFPKSFYFPSKGKVKCM